MNKIASYFLLFFGLMMLGGLWGCKTDSPKKPNPPSTSLAEARLELARNMANGLIIPAYEQLSQRANELEVAVGAFTRNPDAASLLAAREGLKAAWLQWQSAAMYLFGPAENVVLRQSLATYPANEEKIEQNIASGSYILGSLDNQAAVGFPALDYLLNGLGDEAQVLAAYTTDSLADGRRTYLQDLSAEISAKVNASLQGWLAAGDNYVAEFTDPSAGGTDLGSALGLLVNSIDLHFQRFVRDGKVAIPAGIRSAGVPRPKTIEARYGGYAVELLRASLQAYHRLFLGIDANGLDGMGLYDYLLLLEAEQLANDMKNQYESLQAAAEQLGDSMEEEIDQHPERLEALFVDMQKIVVWIKSDMASVMGITLTNQDNDGD